MWWSTMSAHIAFPINLKVGSGQSTSGISWFSLLHHNKAGLVKAAPVTSQLAEDHGNQALETIHRAARGTSMDWNALKYRLYISAALTITPD